MRREKVSWFPLIIILLLYATTQGVGIGFSEPATTISIEPQKSSAEPGQTFNVTVVVTNVTDLYSWSIMIHFNSTILNASSLTRGPFLETAGPTNWQLWEISHPGEPYGIIDNTEGFIIVGDALMPPYPPPGEATGNGTLVTITFLVKAEGITKLSFDEDPTFTSLSTVEEGIKVPIPHYAVYGVFDNRTPGPVPPPVALFDAEPPVANVSDMITFNASASYDPDTWLVSYEWNFGDGITETYKGKNLTAIVTHAYDQGGNYTVSLTVTDYDNLTDTATSYVTVLFHNIAVTSVTALPTTVTVGESVFINVTVANHGNFTETFNVTAYYDNTSIKTENVTALTPGNLTTLTFIWNATDVQPGIYTISANASIVEGETNTADNMLIDGTVARIIILDFPVEVKGITYHVIIKSTSNVSNFETFPEPPKISFQVEGTNGTIGFWNVTIPFNLLGPPYTVMFDGDPRWDKQETTNDTHVFLYLNYTHTLSTHTVEITGASWGPPSELPVATFSPSTTTPFVGDKVTFNASASYDPDGTIEYWNWNFGDGTTGTGEIIDHTYTTAGTFTVTLTVIDNDGLNDTATDDIIVSAAPIHDVAVTNVTVSPTEAEIGKPVSISVVVTNEGELNETFEVTVYYGNTEIKTESINNLAPGDSKTLNITWETTGIDPNTYTIKAVAETVPNETQTDNNTYMYGTVTITEEEPPAFPLNYLIAAIAVAIIVIVAALVYFTKLRKTR